MIKSIIKRQFCCDKNKLWEIITNNSVYSWRSDLSKIDIVDQNHFIEYDKNNFSTYFTITKKKKLKEYKFDIENINLKGKWTGLFAEIDNGNIELTFIEEIEVNSFIMKLFAKLYLKKQQKRYMKDLESELNK